MRGASFLDVGLKRGHNEDRATWLPEARFAAVVDGMGGNYSGAFAALFALQTLCLFWEQHPLDRWPPEALRQGLPLQLAFQLAHLRICTEIEGNRVYQGMGAAAVALLVVPGAVWIGHVGDSRAYRLRGGRIQPLTVDHSLLNEYKKFVPDVTPEQLEQVPRNVITRALGMASKEHPLMADLRLEPLEPGDRFLLCSDGLHGMLPDQEIEAIWAEGSDLTQLGSRLVARANEAGGDDNIGLVLVEG
ncbi:MAG: protein phosphatase 2C domain-containing protein [Polyangiaceae bacterium]|jgi:protein phosphatase|nr:protein phosphatase 2C domain-containing protein [Polyangiaceae bacterium]